MNYNQLSKLDGSLDILDKKDKILIDKRGYYIYYNEPNKLKKEIKIHIHTCGFCAWGSGRKTDKEAGRNGVWIGPFNTPEQAKKFAIDNVKPDKLSAHSCVSKYKTIFKKMKQLIFLLIVFTLNANAQDNKTVTLTVTKQGKTIEEARLNALRDAIEQAYGVFISSKTEILNDNLIKDEIVSTSNGNIQKYEIVSEEKISDIDYVTTLIATVSIEKLTSFIESKGGASELKGSLFGYNLKIKDLAKKSELKAFKNLKPIYEKYLESSIDYDVSIISEPKMISESKVGIRIKATSKFNKNIENFTSYFLKTLRAVSLDLNSVGEYQNLNIPIYSVYISPCVSFEKNKKGKEKKIICEQLFVFRNKETSNEIIDLLDIEKYAVNFEIKNEVNNINGSLLFSESKKIYETLSVNEIEKLHNNDRRPLIFAQTDFSSDYINNQLERNIKFSNYIGIYGFNFKGKLIGIMSGSIGVESMENMIRSTERARKYGGGAGVDWVISCYLDSYRKYGFRPRDKYTGSSDTINPDIFDFEFLKENNPVFSIEFDDFIPKEDINKIKGYTITKNQI